METKRKYRKQRVGQSDLIEVVLQIKPDASDSLLQQIVQMVMGVIITDGTVRVTKSRLRQQGVQIPDGRREPQQSVGKPKSAINQ